MEREAQRIAMGINRLKFDSDRYPGSKSLKASGSVVWRVYQWHLAWQQK